MDQLNTPQLTTESEQASIEVVDESLTPPVLSANKEQESPSESVTNDHKADLSTTLAPTNKEGTAYVVSPTKETPRTEAENKAGINVQPSEKHKVEVRKIKDEEQRTD